MNATDDPGPGSAAPGGAGPASDPHGGPVPGPPPAPVPPRRLTRTPDDKVVAGVAGGLGAYFGLDPVIFRIAFVALALLGGGTGLLLYVIGWIAMPEGGPGDRSAPPTGGGGSTVIIAVVLLVVGGLLFLERLARIGDPWGPSRGFWPGFGLPLLPLALVGLGIWILLAQRDQPDPSPAAGADPRRPGPGAPTAPFASGEPGVPGGPGSPTAPFASGEPATGTSIPAPPPPGEPGVPGGPGAPTAPFASGEPATGTSIPAPPPPGAPAGQGGAGGPSVPSTGPPPPGPPPGPRPAPVRRRSPLGATVLSILLIVGGVAAMLDVSGAMSVSLPGFLAVALVITGLGLVVGAWWGRARGLIALGIVLTLLLGFARVVDVNVAGGIGERIARPTDVTEVEERYRLGMGSFTIDLTRLDDVARVGPVRARVGIGELIVIVPRNATVEVSARSGVGEVVLFGRSQGGMGVEDRMVQRPTPTATPGPDERPGVSPRIEIDAQVGIGKVEVRRG